MQKLPEKVNFFLTLSVLQIFVYISTMECFNSESKKANDYTTKSAIISLFKLFVFISFFFKMIIQVTKFRITFSRYSGKIDVKLCRFFSSKMLVFFSAREIK